MGRENTGDLTVGAPGATWIPWCGQTFAMRWDKPSLGSELVKASWSRLSHSCG